MVSRPYGIQLAGTRKVLRRPIVLTVGISVIAHALAMYVVVERSWQQSSPDSAGSDVVLEIGLNAAAAALESSAPESPAPGPPPAAATPADPSLREPEDQGELEPPSKTPIEIADAVPPERVEVPEPETTVPETTEPEATMLEVAQAQIISATESLLQLPPASNPEIAARSVPPLQSPDINVIPLPSPPEPISTDDLHILEPALTEWIKDHEWREMSSGALLVESNGRRFDVRATKAAAGDPSALNLVTLEVTTTLDGRPMKSLIQVREKAFSHYAKFVNRWDEDVSLANDWVDGRFHSNSPITVADPDHPPHFKGPVTIAARQRISRWLRNADVFEAGVKTGADRIPLPRHVPMPDVDEARTEDKIHYFENDTDIEFFANGEYVWSTPADNSSGRALMGNEATYLLARDKATLSIKGIVRGRVLVYSPRRVSIHGDLHYSIDPQRFPGSEDLLGIVSDGSVEIADSKVTGPGDLTVQGAILARTRFSVRRFRERNQGTLFIYGSMTAGSVSATEPRFATHIQHDLRLVETRPPAFPMTGVFEMVAWDRQWHLQ